MNARRELLRFRVTPDIHLSQFFLLSHVKFLHLALFPVSWTGLRFITTIWISVYSFANIRSGHNKCARQEQSGLRPRRPPTNRLDEVNEMRLETEGLLEFDDNTDKAPFHICYSELLTFLVMFQILAWMRTSIDSSESNYLMFPHYCDSFVSA
jgi:hypothetical protein